MMLVHYHGQLFNASEIGRSLGISDVTVKHYLDILTGTFMVRYLAPWFENIKKRQVKSSKIYLRDIGILEYLLGLENEDAAIRHHPKLGAIWEGFALEEVIRVNDLDLEECFFWGVHGQCELDLFFLKDGKRIGFEFKFMDAPKLTSSIRSVYQQLNLEHLFLIYPGKKDYVLSEGIKVVGLENYLNSALDHHH
jgi:uncharacterized protein